METKDFYFDLPEHLIAQRPGETRGDDRLMVISRQGGGYRHCCLKDLPELIAPGTLMVFNNSRVRRARVYGLRLNPPLDRETEFLFIRPLAGGRSLADMDGIFWQVMVKNARRHKPGHCYRFPDGTCAELVPPELVSPAEYRTETGGEFRVLRFDSPLDESWFDANGHIPLPPYIKREDTADDGERYQTVYAEESGSVAAPTAGLHFTQELLDRIAERGIDTAWVTLHVGLGTFLPVRTEKIEDHTMHSETYTVPEETARKVNLAKAEGRPVLAVGTTSVRTLESASGDGILRAGSGSTRIFIYPGYCFRIADQLFTNFHTPESTLLMLVSAFAGRDHILAAYAEAVKKQYRFFSYGDAMLIR
ncbi:MAG: tRNA preQ1(34) S-adenosylmethionine ribosyltransferase-isomerase QueA [Spirochaetaceae bacterium]|jgi:S-adenosylmethionine:tRNA ribosyltransferase-isomerase|nr:tRNA preQ1(34) S-adenosylmethionine ribosyltransferase-isomerase QueA [Spirochaetaceae bacterium]